MTVCLNKYSFCYIHKLTPFRTKTNLRENRFFCGKVGDWLTKRALIVLNFLLKTRQKEDYAVHTALTIARKACTLTTTSANGSKRVALGQWGQVGGNAEAVCTRQPIFSL